MQRACSAGRVQINFLEKSEWGAVYSWGPRECQILKTRQWALYRAIYFSVRFSDGVFMETCHWCSAQVINTRGVKRLAFSIHTGSDPDLPRLQPEAPGMTWMNRADWDRTKQPFNDNYWPVQSRSDSEKETRQAKPFMIVCVTNHSHFIPFSCGSLSHKCRFLSVHLGGGGESQVKPQQADR